jgi:hypothetical protein
MDYLRTDFPRTAGTAFTNFIANPERPHYKSDVKSLAVSGSQRLSDAIELRAFSNVNWVRAWYSDSSNTAFVLESASEVRSVILSTGGGLGWKATEGLRFDLGYRFDNYIDRKEGDAPLSLDDRRHTFTLAVTIDLGLVRGAVRAATN